MTRITVTLSPNQLALAYVLIDYALESGAIGGDFKESRRELHNLRHKLERAEDKAVSRG